VATQLQSAPEAAGEALDNDLRDRDDFIGNLLHMLRNPLAPVYMRICHLTERVERTPEAAVDPTWLLPQLIDLRGRVEAYVATLGRLQDLVPPDANILRPGGEIVDLAVVVRAQVAGRQREAAVAGVVLHLVAEGDTCGRWSLRSLERICFHLLSNAIRYGAGKPVDVRITGEATRVQLEIRDRGIGIAPEDLDGLFQFYQRRPAGTNGGGFGVSLALVRQLVERLGGDVAVDSALGEGSTFTVTLPRHDT
jgi:signal transduction histidine kinase